jgi:hypothetical protein
MSKKLKGILGLLAGGILAGAGAYALTKKGVSEDDACTEGCDCDDEEETTVDDVEESAE